VMLIAVFDRRYCHRYDNPWMPWRSND